MKLELFYSDYCPFCQIVLTELKNLKIKDKVDLLETQSNQAAAKRLHDTTGRRTVPCLFIDNQPMFESRDIMNWFKENKSKIEG